MDAIGKMPPTGGIAIGVERLLMVLANVSDIREFYFSAFGGASLKKN